ncbi:MAG TPA: rhomboid family intramembrane serine protease [Candidatus Saccharimonadales bacterium]|nr:rhomboid family intramembrane serine protease [Candidatus Saccharimonadales bacterium]
MFFIPYGAREATRRQRFPYVTYLLLGANVAVFLLQLYLIFAWGEIGLQRFIDMFAVVPADITDGTPLELSLITAMFLHSGLLHIAGNMLYLLPFGDNVEDRLGHGRYILFYLLCGIAASLTHVAFEPHSFIPALGASGAIAGVLAGYLALHPRGVVKGFLFIFIILLRVDLPAVVFVGFWFVLQLFSGVAALGNPATAGGVAFMAHVGGFVGGLVLAPLFAATNRKWRNVPVVS